MTIDLGSREWSPDAIPGRRLPPRTRRILLAVGLVLLSALAAGPSAPQRPGLHAPLWTTRGPAMMSFDAERVYLVDEGHREVTAVDSRTGEVRWRRPFTDMPADAATVSDGIIAVATFPPSSAGEEKTHLLRASTGEPLRTVDGLLLGPLGVEDRYLFSSYRFAPESSCMGDDGNGCQQLAVVDVRTGATAWRTTLPPGAHVLSGLSETPRDERIVVVGPNGVLTGHDVPSGAVLTEWAVPGWGEADVQREARLTGDRLLTLVSRPDTPSGDVTRAEVATFDLRSGAPVWSTTVRLRSLVEHPGGPFVYLLPCGDAVCLFGNSASAVVDLATGTIRFTVPGARVEQYALSPLLLSSQFGAPRNTPQPRWDLVGLDPMTGAERVRLGRASPFPWDHPARPGMLLTRAGTESSDILRLDGDRVTTLGTLPGVDLICQAVGVLLGCQTQERVLSMWRLPFGEGG